MAVCLADCMAAMLMIFNVVSDGLSRFTRLGSLHSDWPAFSEDLVRFTWLHPVKFQSRCAMIEHSELPSPAGWAYLPCGNVICHIALQRANGLTRKDHSCTMMCTCRASREGVLIFNNRSTNLVVLYKQGSTKTTTEVFCCKP